MRARSHSASSPGSYPPCSALPPSPLISDASGLHTLLSHTPRILPPLLLLPPGRSRTPTSAPAPMAPHVPGTSPLPLFEIEMSCQEKCSCVLITGMKASGQPVFGASANEGGAMLGVPQAGNTRPLMRPRNAGRVTLRPVARAHRVRQGGPDRARAQVYFI